MTESPDSSLFGDALPAAAPAPAYRVLARKYRPGNFAGLIGQEAMVQTLGNAIARGRLAQAWLMTGVRGVGKTSTARIIARALNCIGADGTGGPTIDPCGICTHCTQIASGSHMDVIEIDAASNTGVDNVRELIEAVRYAPGSARFKIYIIDEVHMMSKAAFNALLKTLEEPPPHVKFIFATTEVEKLPVTVLSRCQRFDLKRVPATVLAAHFQSIALAENVAVEPDALTMIARAAEGSVRDGLSLLDQAIAHGGDHVSADAVRAMLGLADRGAVRALFGHCLAGDAAAMLSALEAQYAQGTDPEALLRDLLGLVHGITRTRLAPADDATLSAEERETLNDWAQRLDFPALHRLWQLLLKGLADVHIAPDPGQACEMALLRLIHASDLPDPAELLRSLRNGETVPGPAPQAASRALEATRAMAAPSPAAPLPAAPLPATTALPADFQALVALFQDKTQPLIAHMLAETLRLIEYSPAVPLLVLGAGPGAPPAEAARIAPLLREWSGADWQVRIETGGDAPTLREAELTAAAARHASAAADPVVAALVEGFSGAELLDVVPDPENRSPHAQSR